MPCPDCEPLKDRAEQAEARVRELEAELICPFFDKPTTWADAYKRKMDESAEWSTRALNAEARVRELEQALRLHLAVGPDDPLLIEPIEKQLAAAEARVRLYDDLIYAVESKWPNETRHETALRYIREREHRKDQQVYQAAEPTGREEGR